MPVRSLILVGCTMVSLHSRNCDHDLLPHALYWMTLVVSFAEGNPSQGAHVPKIHQESEDMTNWRKGSGSHPVGRISWEIFSNSICTNFTWDHGVASQV